MGIPNPTHQALSNRFAALIRYVALFTAAAGTTGSNEASGGSYARVAVGTPTPDGVGDNTFPQVNIPCPAGNYVEGGFFSTSMGASLPAPSGVTATAVAGGSLAAGTTRYYKVTGFNWSGETLAGLEVSATPSGSNLSVQISWAALTGVSDLTGDAATLAGFRIYRGDASNGENVLVGTVPASATSFTDTGGTTTSKTPPATGSASTFVGSNAFDGGTVTVTGSGASINVAPSVSV